jgi:hypothetical protein
MKYSPRQMVVRAQEAAGLLLRTLEGERLVARFLDSYAVEFHRPGRAAHPAQYRDLVATIGREALLTMVVRVDCELPRRLGAAARARHKTKIRSNPLRRRATPRAASVASSETAELFRDELLMALAQALGWGDEEFEEFCRDLELYKQLGARDLRAARPRRVAAGVSGPFVDRVGLLLDPSMFDKARRAAGKFDLQLQGATHAVLKRVFALRREN